MFLMAAGVTAVSEVRKIWFTRSLVCLGQPGPLKLIISYQLLLLFCLKILRGIPNAVIKIIHINEWSSNRWYRSQKHPL